MVKPTSAGRRPQAWFMTPNSARAQTRRMRIALEPPGCQRRRRGSEGWEAKGETVAASSPCVRTRRSTASPAASWSLIGSYHLDDGARQWRIFEHEFASSGVSRSEGSSGAGDASGPGDTSPRDGRHAEVADRPAVSPLWQAGPAGVRLSIVYLRQSVISSAEARFHEP